jgi:hypothetical protein
MPTVRAEQTFELWSLKSRWSGEGHGLSGSPSRLTSFYLWPLLAVGLDYILIKSSASLHLKVRPSLNSSTAAIRGKSPDCWRLASARSFRTMNNWIVLRHVTDSEVCFSLSPSFCLRLRVIHLQVSSRDQNYFRQSWTVTRSPPCRAKQVLHSRLSQVPSCQGPSAKVDSTIGAEVISAWV